VQTFLYVNMVRLMTISKSQKRSLCNVSSAVPEYQKPVILQFTVTSYELTSENTSTGVAAVLDAMKRDSAVADKPRDAFMRTPKLSSPSYLNLVTLSQTIMGVAYVGVAKIWERLESR